MSSYSSSSQKKRVNGIHLALSLNSGCWPEQSEPLLFDSGSYGSAINLLEDGFSIAPSPWTLETGLDVISKINDYYELLLQNICDSFNEKFNKRSIRFYRILLGPTLYWMLNVFYDRYWRVQVIYKQFPNIKFPFANYDKVFISTYDFVVSSKESENYNAKIISYITRNLNVENSYYFPSSNDQSDFSIHEPHTNAVNILKKCKGYVIDELTKIFIGQFKKPHIISHKLNFNISLFDRLKNKTFMPYNNIFSPIPKKKLSSRKEDRLRRELHTLMKKHSKYESDNFLGLFIEFFVGELPLSFLEHHEFYNSCAEEQQQKYPMEIICSSIGWYFDEPFKYFSAGAVERGVKLVGFQHGGNYQIIKEHFAFNHEKKITDFYFTLGETERKQENSDVYFSEKFCASNGDNEINEKNILFVSTSPCKFLIEFPCVTERSGLYIKNQIAFINELQKKGFEDFVYRPYNNDRVWNLTKAIKKIHPEIKIDSEPDFSTSLSIAKLAIFDNLSTTFLESLARNKPTILCWSQKMYCINQSSEKYFNDLFNLKILHYCYKDAADTVQLAVSTGLEKWWRNSKRQECINKFLSHFVSENLCKDVLNNSNLLKKIQQIYDMESD